MFEEARSVLDRYFGYSEFRPGQDDAVKSALSGRDTLIVMPTGGGKSVCFQVPALVLPGLTIVVSPLIALMLDQVSVLEGRGIAAALINSTLSKSEIDDRLARAAAGELKLLYVAPERFASPVFQRALRRMDVSMVAVDEAHCVCEWGHDFRPSYLQLRDAWAMIGRPRLLALTATATPEVRREIVRELDLRRARVIVRGFDRPNLRLTVRQEDKLTEKSRVLLSLLRDSDEVAIVYASTRKMVEAATELLRSAGVSAVAYHAGLHRDQRLRAQEAWMSGEIPVVVATNAFGMGVDKADVRRVVHFQMPGSLEAYYQEAGRAGRDGEPAECILLHSYRDRFTHEFFIRANYPSRRVIVSAYSSLCAAVQSSGGPVTAARFAARVKGAKSEQEVYSAMRILGDCGSVEDVGKRRGCVVRWIAAPERIANLIENGNGAEDLHQVLPLLESLYSASSSGERRHLRFSRRDVARWSGGDFGAARVALDALQSAGVLGWRDEGRSSGYRPKDPRLPGENLPVNWTRVAARRTLEFAKLKRMEGYAYQRSCRRRYVLRYFGEQDGRGRCGSCDRCASQLSQ